jgi:predicted MPP superfamily phosphohydrolase
VWRIFFTSALALYAVFAVYAGLRLSAFLRYCFPRFRRLVFWPLYLLAAGAPFIFFLTRNAGNSFTRLIGMYAMAFFLYLVLALFLTEPLRLILFSVRKERRRKRGAVLTGAAIVLALIAFACGLYHARDIKTKEYYLTIEKPSPPQLASKGGTLRIALVSDFHIGDSVGKKWIGDIVDKINEAGPGMVCIAGDIFDGNLNQARDSLESVAAELARIRAPYGVYACLGNHDRPGEAAATRRFLESANITLLEDQAEFTPAGIVVAGRKDYSPLGARYQAPRLDAASLAKASGDIPAPLIILDHQPMSFAEEKAAGADLVLSGHTHKGQMFPFNLVTRLIYKKYGTHYGIYRDGSFQALVTSGAGVWGPPLRVATDSEVAVITVGFR